MGHGDRSGKEYMRVLNTTVGGSGGLMTKAAGVCSQTVQTSPAGPSAISGPFSRVYKQMRSGGCFPLSLSRNNEPLWIKVGC